MGLTATSAPGSSEPRPGVLSTPQCTGKSHGTKNFLPPKPTAVPLRNTTALDKENITPSVSVKQLQSDEWGEAPLNKWSTFQFTGLCLPAPPMCLS